MALCTAAWPRASSKCTHGLEHAASRICGSVRHQLLHQRLPGCLQGAPPIPTLHLSYHDGEHYNSIRCAEDYGSGMPMHFSVCARQQGGQQGAAVLFSPDSTPSELCQFCADTTFLGDSVENSASLSSAQHEEHRVMPLCTPALSTCHCRRTGPYQRQSQQGAGPPCTCWGVGQEGGDARHGGYRVLRRCTGPAGAAALPGGHG